MLLPGRVTFDSVVDLSNLVLDAEVGEFIFGSPVEIIGNTIRDNQEGDQADEVIDVQRATPMPDGTALVSLARTMKGPAPGETRSRTFYVRFRYECAGPREIVQYKEWGFNKKGAIFDTRINDIRSISGTVEAEALADVSQSYVFLIAPSKYVPVYFSPDTKYSRSYENKNIVSLFRQL